MAVKNKNVKSFKRMIDEEDALCEMLYAKLEEEEDGNE